MSEIDSNLSKSDLEDIEDDISVKVVIGCAGISIMYYEAFNSAMLSIGMFLALLGFINLYIHLYVLDKAWSDCNNG